MISTALLALALALEAFAAPADGQCKLGNCNVSKRPLYLPDSVQSNVTVPTDQTAIFYGIGEGYQNYTCSTSDATAVPVAAGAVARLYDASCKSFKFQDLTGSKYQQEITNGVEATQNATMLGFLGYHYFQSTGNGSSPVFDFRTGAVQTDTGFGALPSFPENEHVYKMAVITKKVGSATSPDLDAATTVPWLSLVSDPAVDGQGDLASTVLRIWTHGGQPNSTCEGSNAAFSIAYTAIYAFYK